MRPGYRRESLLNLGVVYNPAMIFQKLWSVMKRVCTLPGKHATGIQKGEPISVLALFTNPAMIFQKLWSVMKRVCTLPGKHATGIQKGEPISILALFTNPAMIFQKLWSVMKSLPIAREACDRDTEGRAYFNLGLVYNSRNDASKSYHGLGLFTNPAMIFQKLWMWKHATGIQKEEPISEFTIPQ